MTTAAVYLAAFAFVMGFVALILIAFERADR